jgi:formylglycine-generating enzyme required for sulfatase activity
MKAPLKIQIFLSSPGDVADERGLAARIVKEELPYDALFRGRLTFDLVSWDDPAAPTPMLANLTPQEAVECGLPKPSECDFVVVILWARLGTPLPERYRKANGERYLSGTEWEFEDALKGAGDALKKEGHKLKPAILVYRRIEPPLIRLTDPEELNEKGQQYQYVKQFFENFKNPDGSLKRSFVCYSQPSQFADKLKNNLRSFLTPIAEDLIRQEERGKNKTKKQADLEPSWLGSPYPGLRAFTAKEEVIFFGRGNEVDKLIKLLREPEKRFLTVVGASGTGKSSLVQAGLLPRLKKNAVEGSKDWRVLDFKLEALENPFEMLAVKLSEMLPADMQNQRPSELAARLQSMPEQIGTLAAQVLAGLPEWAELLLFVDQFEELFTPSVKESYRSPFVAMLASAATSECIRVLVTLRADFLIRAAESATKLPELLQAGTFPLAPPREAALSEMICRPAQVAGVTLEDGVADKILEDAGNDPGALPLVAFCLNELYNKSAPERCITLRQYQEMGGLHEAIGKHAATAVERTLPRGRDDILEILFSKLVIIDRDGHAVRRRAPNRELDRDEAVSRLVRELSGDQGRLLTYTEATVELSHDALLDEWLMLKEWIERNRADMRLWTELEHDVNNWLRPPHDNSLLWKGRKLQEARKLLKREPPYLPKNITIDDMKRFIKASISARRKTRVNVCVISSAFSICVFCGIMVYIIPSLLPRTAMPVGSFDDHHPFRLYDVLGNVWEWTQDCVTTENTQTGSSAQAANKYDWCLARGGSWDSHEEWKVRASYRLPLARDHRVPTVGFRVARDLDNEQRRVADLSKLHTKPIQDCKEECPQMVILQGGDFRVRAPLSDMGACENQWPRTAVTIKPFAIGQYEVTVKEWNACVKDNRCEEKVFEKTNGHRPITNVSREDAQKYVNWLSSQTGKKYRLPSGTEWEYAARGDKDTCRWWGNELDRGKANCAACGLTWEQFFDWLHLTVVSDVMSDVTSEARRIFNKLQAQHPQ